MPKKSTHPIKATLEVEGQLDIFQEEKDKISDAQKYARAAWWWIKNDKRRFLEFQRIIFDAIEKHGMMRIQRDPIADRLVQKGFSLSDSKMFKFDHNIWAPLIRYMLSFYPWLKNHYTLRSDGLPYHLVTFEAVPSEYFLRNAQCQNREITRRDWE